MKALELAGKLDVARTEYWGINAPIAKPVLENAATELRRLAEVNAELVREMGRYLPVINKAEDSPIWGELTNGTGIATANGYRAGLVKAKEKK